MVCRIVAVERDESTDETDESTDEVFGKRFKDLLRIRKDLLRVRTGPSYPVLDGDGCFGYSRPSWPLIGRPTWVDPEEE